MITNIQFINPEFKSIKDAIDNVKYGLAEVIITTDNDKSYPAHLSRDELRLKHIEMQIASLVSPNAERVLLLLEEYGQIKYDDGFCNN